MPEHSDDPVLLVLLFSQTYALLLAIRANPIAATLLRSSNTSPSKCKILQDILPEQENSVIRRVLGDSRD